MYYTSIFTIAAYVGILFLNLLGSLAYFIATAQNDQINNSSGVTFGLSILWLILFSPCSFICWYRPLYKAFRFVNIIHSLAIEIHNRTCDFIVFFCEIGILFTKSYLSFRSDSSFNFFVFFFIFFFQFITTCLQAVAPDGWGTV